MDARATWSDGGRLIQEADHTFRLTSRDDGIPFELVVEFSPTRTREALPSAVDVRAASETHWTRF